MCGKVTGGQLSALYKESFPGQGSVHMHASGAGEGIQAASLISSSHGVSFLT